MLDYVSATRLYEGRKCKHLGRKVRNGVYMKHDPERECFVLSELWSTSECVPDPDRPGQVKYQKAPKERWDTRPFAKVYPGRVVITRLVSGKVLYALFDVDHCVSRTVKLSGRSWFYRGKTVQGDVPMVVDLRAGTLTPVVPPKVRAFNNEKRKEMNRMIQSVRNLMKVRAKLGAFDKLTPGEVDKYMRQTYDTNKWQVYDNPAKFLELMRAVDPEDFKSFYPLLWLADKNWWVYKGSNENYGRVDWVARYNSLVDRMREKMRHELGVVEYVEADERSADSSDGCVEADRANELREVQVPVPA